MKNHYIPQYNEREFGRIAKHADAYYAEQRKKAATQNNDLECLKISDARMKKLEDKYC